MTSYLTLAQAAALIPDADADTLKRRARQGKLVTYRPGKAYLTTEADLRRMVELCRVVRKAPDYGSGLPVVTAPALSPTQALGLSSTEAANASLAAVLTNLEKPNKS